jgi:hypothetical protein
LKLYCSCQGKRFHSKLDNSPYYKKVCLLELYADSFVASNPSKCRLCKKKTIFVKGVDVVVEPEEGEVVVYISEE